jgi:type IV secretory pathway component VirB8
MSDFKKIVKSLNNDDEEELDLSELKSVQIDKERTLMDITGKRNYYSLVALFAFNVMMATYQIYLNESDDIAISYSLPDQRNMDAPVLLKEADHGTVRDVDTLVKGFVRQYLRARYPKNALEARMMYTFISRHSEGDIKRDFDARLDRLEEIKSKLNGGQTVNIYPKSSEDLKIRKNGILGNWIAEFDGRYVADTGISDSARAYVKVRLEITQGAQSIKNSPSGFYVTEYKVTYIKDGVTNEMGEVGI